MNLLQETMHTIDAHGLTIFDVAFVCDYETKKKIDINEFMELTRNFDYDNGYGGVNVNLRLMIVFSNGAWLERYEYDGAECWKYREPINEDFYRNDDISIKEPCRWR